MRIVLLNPFHGGSHAAVAEGFARHSRHQVELLTLPIFGGWRWRMRGGAVSMARMLLERDPAIDLLLSTDMLDAATFLGLLSAAGRPAPPLALYFHENQLTYPLPPGRPRDLSLPWINYTSALAAKAVFFNSAFHRRTFLEALPGLLGRYYDFQELETIAQIEGKSHVLPPGIDLARLEGGDPRPDGGPPIILWNGRWEYDKQPGAFFAALELLAARGVAFRLIVAGEHIDPNAPDFVAAKERWADRIVHWGYAPGDTAYRDLLLRADVVVSTALQEFFGIGVLEALFCGCVPVLPRRLTYPELLPPAFHDCLYTTPAALVDRLEATLANLPALQARPWRTLATPFAWPTIIGRYDEAMERIGGWGLGAGG